ncbi:hypothetical protein HRbin04_00950 [archaeon HR04]|nr:hypothetical protein HRbin04_00950 [archaeon HR04]
MTSEVYSRIEAAGIYGVRRVDLRKEFGDDVDKHVEELISSGLIFSDKKSGAITYWTKDNYIKYVMESDPKFKLIQVMINSISNGTTSRDEGCREMYDALEERVMNRIHNTIDERVRDLNRYIDEHILSIKNDYSSVNNQIMQEISSIKEELSNKLSLLNTIIDERISSTNNDLNLKLESVKNEFNTSTSRLEEKINSILMDVERRIVSMDVADEIQDIRNVMNENVSSIREEMDKRLNTLHLEIESRISALKDDLSSRMIRIDESIHDELTRIKVEMGERISALSDEIKAIGSMLEEVKVITNGNGHANGNGKNNNNASREHITLEQFRIDFDRMLAEASSSIGWVELVSIRERMCRKYDITAHEFYSLVSQLLERFSNRYELSSGGQEGIVIRGLVHGFVRRI